VRSRRRNLSLALLAVATVAGTAGCVSQPWQLPDPYGYGSGAGTTSQQHPYGSGAYGYGSRYGYGSPYYYSYRQGAPYYYPGYAYPPYPGSYCRDANRDGRCDYRQDDDDDHHHPGNDDHDNGGGKGQDGSPPRLGERPFKDVRRQFRQVEPSGADVKPRPAGAAPVQVIPRTPAARSGAATAPVQRSTPRAPVPVKAPPRAERDGPRSTAPSSPTLRATSPAQRER
jgi:hypothetical protein